LAALSAKFIVQSGDGRVNVFFELSAERRATG
jgi:hypothetical protein